MIRYSQLEHKFVNNLPDVLESSILYVSMEYGTTAHQCCCGCGEEIITPLTPTDWQIDFDGESISLQPSIGNWDLECRSHYVIRRGCVVEAGAWSDEQIVNERIRDKYTKMEFYKSEAVVNQRNEISGSESSLISESCWQKLKRQMLNFMPFN